MNLYTCQSLVNIDEKTMTVTLLHSVYLEHLDRHAHDLMPLVKNQSFYFECLGKLTLAFLKGQSCLIYIDDTVKQVYIIENISVCKTGSGLCVNFGTQESIWNFKTKSDLDIWETQLLLVQNTLEKPIIPPKVQTPSPPSTPVNQSSTQKTGSFYMRMNKSWLSFNKPRKQKKVKEEFKEKIVEEVEEETVEVEIMVTDDDFKVSPNNDRLLLDLEDQPDIFSDLKILL